MSRRMVRIGARWAAGLSFVALLVPGAAQAQMIYGQATVQTYAPPPPVVQTTTYVQPAPVVQTTYQPAVVAQPAYMGPVHAGFYVRLLGGLGGGAFFTQDPSSSTSLTLSGLGYLGQVALGAWVGPDLALHLDASAFGLINPTVSAASGSSVTYGVSGQDYITTQFGGGATYYFMPWNTYISGSVGLAYLRSQIPGSPGSSIDTGVSNLGLGVTVAVGKEWAIGPSLGIGVALMGMYALIPNGNSQDFNNVAGGVALSLSGY